MRLLEMSERQNPGYLISWEKKFVPVQISPRFLEMCPDYASRIMYDG